MENAITQETDLGEGEQGQVRRWLKELKLAESRDKDWKKVSREIWSKYRGEKRRKNSFNILWANTETLLPAIFNSAPKPDVRRRFRDEDPIGKVAAEVIRRSLEFSIDTERFDSAIRMDVLDMLLPGRGVSRVRYVPSLTVAGQETDSEDSDEELAWEQVLLEHIQWDDLRLGPGKTWEQVCWVAFYHRMTRDELVEKFGEEKGNAVKLDDIQDEQTSQWEERDREVFQTAGVWEIWDKDEKKVRFVSEGQSRYFLGVNDDPLKLQGFFPIPKPIYAVTDSCTLNPLPLYEQYREQAQELDRISGRINKLIDACKLRGIYDSRLSEMAELIRGDDNDLIPATNAVAMAERGFEKAIWMMPIEEAAKVVQLLYTQREATKQVIYEITGISDILRGATDPNETLGAQQIKAQSGSQRVAEMQRDVARYTRDLMRMMAEIVGERFQLDTLQQMTGMQLPMAQEVPPGQQAITWEMVLQVIRDDKQRTFKVDIETDSTVAATIQEDMSGLRDVLTSVVQFISGIGPAVQAGAVPIEAVKEIIMTICRRAKMGNAVEDALDKIQAPQQQGGDPAQAQMQAEQQRAQMEAQKQQMLMQVEQARIASEEKMHQMQLAQEAAIAERESAMEAQLQTMKARQDAQIEIILAEIKKATAIEVAEMNQRAQSEADVSVQ